MAGKDKKIVAPMPCVLCLNNNLLCLSVRPCDTMPLSLRDPPRCCLPSGLRPFRHVEAVLEDNL